MKRSIIGGVRFANLVFVIVAAAPMWGKTTLAPAAAPISAETPAKLATPDQPK